jgi:hypothetical protein
MYCEKKKLLILCKVYKASRPPLEDDYYFICDDYLNLNLLFYTLFSPTLELVYLLHA